MSPVDPDPVTAKGPTDSSTSVGVQRPVAASPRTVNLGRGKFVPYPEPVDAAATKVGKGNRRKDTKPEIRLRSALHRRGFRFRKDHLLRAGEVRVRPDIVFPRWTLAVFVDGCFWHGCPEHQHVPQRNRDYWVPKLEANTARDRRVDAALIGGGWEVMRLWEHEDVEAAAQRVAAALDRRRAHSRLEQE